MSEIKLIESLRCTKRTIIWYNDPEISLLLKWIAITIVGSTTNGTYLFIIIACKWVLNPLHRTELYIIIAINIVRINIYI